MDPHQDARPVSVLAVLTRQDVEIDMRCCMGYEHPRKLEE
jgi:hypothetical protein